MVGQAVVQPACREQKAFLSGNAVHQGGRKLSAQAAALCFSGLWFHQTDRYHGKVCKG